MQPPCSQPSVNVCARIKCPFFEVKPNSGGCPRYSKACQCHLNTVAELQFDDSWLFTTNESQLQQLKKVNDRFLAKDKASHRQLKQLAERASQPQQPQVSGLENKVASTLEVGVQTGG